MRRIQAQRIHHPVGYAVGVVDGIGRGQGIVDGAEVIGLPRIGQAIVVGVAGQVGDGRLEQSHGISRIMNAQTAVLFHEQPVVSRFQLGLGPGRINGQGRFDRVVRRQIR